MNRVRYYSAAPAVARLSGTLATTYRTRDGRFVLSEKQVGHILSQQEGKTVGDLDIEEVSEEDARRLIELGGYQMGEK